MLRGLSVVTGLAAVVGLAACSPAAGPAGRAVTAGGAAPGHSQGAAAGSAAKSTRSSSPADGKPAASVTISAVGDTMLGNTPDLPADPAGYFDAVKPVLDHGARIVFGNLE